MARPVGQFNAQKETCFNILSKLSGPKGCTSTNKFLSACLGVNINQVAKYLRALKAEGRITVTTTPLKINSNTRSKYRKRWIEVAKPATPSLLDNCPAVLEAHEAALDVYRQEYEAESALGHVDKCQSLLNTIFTLEGETLATPKNQVRS